MDETARDVVAQADMLVVEKLKGICNKTKVKRRLTKTMRRSIGSWNIRYWLSRLQARAEDNRVVFRSVPAFYTSIECSACGYTDRSNRDREVFLCQKCGHSDNADVNAAKNILSRLLLGPYGAEFKLMVDTGVN
jgi:putative transposase